MADRKMRAFACGVAKTVGERQVRVVVSTPTVDRVGDVVEVGGIDLTEYRRNPIVLCQHDHDEPVARCVEIEVVSGRLEALVQFPPIGTSTKADETYGLIKAGVLNAVSIGFIPREWSDLNDKDPWGGRRYSASEMIEFSIVSVPANPDALIIERAVGGILEADHGSPLVLDSAVTDTFAVDEQRAGEIRALEIRWLEIAAG